jgi:hypothetical protein
MTVSTFWPLGKVGAPAWISAGAHLIRGQNAQGVGAAVGGAEDSAQSAPSSSIRLTPGSEFFGADLAAVQDLGAVTLADRQLRSDPRLGRGGFEEVALAVADPDRSN